MPLCKKRSKNFTELLKEKLAEFTNDKNVKCKRVFAQDEARLGLIDWHRRRYCPKGIRPPCTVRRVYKWTWLYAAVEPTTGEQACLSLPYLDGDCLEVFLAELAKDYPAERIVLLTDNAPSHIKATR